MAQCEPIDSKKLRLLQFFSVELEALLETSVPFLHCPKLPLSSVNMLN